MTRAAAGSENTLLGRVGFGLLVAFGLVALLAPWIAPHDPTAYVTAPFARPSPAHPLGGNDVGQDLLSELIYGTRISLLFGVVAAVFGTGVGLLVGLSAGYFRGAVDRVLMRLVDVVLVMPFLPLLLILAAFIGPGVLSELVVISAVMWAGPARELRSQTLSLRERGHVQAALAMGARPAYVLRRHVLPGVASLIPPQLVRAAKAAILLEASLSFLGLGDPTVRSWGTMLYYANARSAYLTDAWLWWVLPPGLALGGLVLAFALAGYALEAWGRPRAARGAAGSAPAPTRRRPGRRNSVAAAASEAAVTARATGPGPARNTDLLDVRGLDVRYDTGGSEVAAVRGIDLQVGRAEIVGLIGESGSGKSTVVATMFGVLPPAARVMAGRVLLSDRDLLTISDSELRGLRGDRIALIPQAAQNALNPVMRVLDQVAESIVAHRPFGRHAARDRAAELLAAVRIPAERHRAFPHEFSGGMRQRALIAMALANDPDLVVADEPTTGLDGGVKLDVLELLASLARDADRSLLLVSHDLPAVFHVADRVAVMREGEIVEVGSTAQLAAEAEHPYTRRLLASIPSGSSSGLPSGHPSVGRPGGADVPGEPCGPAEPAVASLETSCTKPANGPILIVNGVTKRFGRAGQVVALEDASLEVGEGEIVGVVGASGAGKSTLARLIFGLERADAGTIHFRPSGRAAGTTERLSRRRHLIFQDPYSALPPHLRTGAIVAEPLWIHGAGTTNAAAGGVGSAAEAVATAEAVAAALEEVELRPASRFVDRFPHELSGGERQRVALARALILEPDLIVADEPASLLDASLRRDLVAQLARLRRVRGTAILYITHDVGLAAELCDRLVVLDAGRVVERGPTRRLLESPAHPATAGFVDVWRRLDVPLQLARSSSASPRISDTAGESGS